MKRQSQATTYRNLDPEIIKMMDETKVCLCCGKSLSYLPDKYKRRNRGYCSKECYVRKPPRIAYVEKIYNRPFEEVLLEMLNSGKSLDVAGRLLRFSHKQIYAYMKKLSLKKIIRWVKAGGANQ